MKTETNTKHTPGPWSFDGHGINTGGARLATINKTAQISTGKAWRAIEQPESDANAKLMAAAPELLEALNGLIMSAAWHIETQKNGVAMDSKMLAAARSAIALATGN